MHLVLAFAAPLSAAFQPAYGRLPAPQLCDWLARAGAPQAVAQADEWSLTTPHERVMAAHHWAPAAPVAAGPAAATDPAPPGPPDGLVPLAAWLAQAHRLPEAEQPGWALVTPSHWSLGTEQLSLQDPSLLSLDEAESRSLHAAVGELFTSESYAWHWLSPTQWLCRHEELAELPTASLDRVIGRNVDRWLTADPRARRLRRLQNEAQMLLHSHPLNAEREARGDLPVNSLWCSGTGTLPPRGPAASQPLVQLSTSLRSAALSDDVAAWLEAFAAWDADTFGPWVQRHGQDSASSLTLCGERSALRWTAGAPPGAAATAAPRGWQRMWKRLRPGAQPATPAPGAALAAWLESI
jgi:hypothetical protein